MRDQATLAPQESGPPNTSKGRKPVALLAAGGLLLGSAVFGFTATGANASSHREAPLIAADPAVDNTDVYAFSSPEDESTVTFIANWIPFSEPNGGPNFYPWATNAAYDINIDNNGDAVADLIYRWVFETQDLRGTDTFLYNNGPVTSLTDENLLFRQTYDLTVSADGGATFPVTLLDNAPVAPSYTGDASMGGPDGYEALRNEAIAGGQIGPGGVGGQSAAFQADDSFFLDLRIFDLLYGGDLSETGQDTLAGYNVNSIALQVPKAAVAIAGDAANNPVVGVWSTTSRLSVTTRNADGSATQSGPFQQVSRLGMPLVNEVVVPVALKDAFNAIDPTQDAAALDAANPAGRILAPEVPALIEAIYGIPAPPTPRWDIFEVFLTGIVSTAVYDIDGDPATANPLDIDLNSQTLNALAVPDAAFQPSEMLRLNMSVPVSATPNRLGVVGGDIAGFPNGRRLGDDVVDIEILALEGVYDINNIPPDRAAAGVAALAGGDGVDVNDNVFANEYPYLSLPNTQAVNGGGGTGGGGQSPVPPAAAPAPPAPGPTPGPTPPGNGYPRGGVQTGAGGLQNQYWVPAMTGAAAMLLLVAGGTTLVRGRLGRSTGTPTSES